MGGEAVERAQTEPGGGFLRKLDEPEVHALKERGRRRHFKRGATLFNEGDESSHVVVLEAGRVKISAFTEEGSEVVLAIRQPDDLLGELSVFDEEPRSATATALEDVEALVVGADGFKSFLQEHPRVALLLLGMISHRLRDADAKRIEYGTQDTVGRVARRLVELADRFGESAADGLRISVPLSQQELAGWTGASREGVSKALQTLRKRGWIETHRKHVTVLDLEALARRGR